jgi:hypothetical protein
MTTDPDSRVGRSHAYIPRLRPRPMSLAIERADREHLNEGAGVRGVRRNHRSTWPGMVGRPPVDNRGKAGRRRGPQPAVDRRTPRKYACCACCRAPASVKGLTPRHPLTVTHRKAVRADVRAPGHSRHTASMTLRRVTSHAWGALPSAEWMRSKGGAAVASVKHVEPKTLGALSPSAALSPESAR